MHDPGIREFQHRIEAIYGARDKARGLEGTYMWFIEEVGELARSFINQRQEPVEEAREFADCLAWLSTLASLRGIDLAQASWEKYAAGCPRCHRTPCGCRHRGGEGTDSAG